MQSLTKDHFHRKGEAERLFIASHHSATLHLLSKRIWSKLHNIRGIRGLLQW